MVVGGIVLCGGRSERMGRSKALLPFGPESMLQRVVQLLGEAVRPLVVVAAPGQDLPVLPSAGARRSRSRRGMRAAWKVCTADCALASREVEAAFVSGCDTPLSRPAFVHRMIEQLGDFDVAVPREGHLPASAGRCLPYCLAETIRDLLDRQQFRLQDFYRRSVHALCRCRIAAVGRSGTR